MTLHLQTIPTDNSDPGEHKFSLVNGTFSAQDGGYLILQLLHQKIEFLTLKSLGKNESGNNATDVIEYLRMLSDQADIVRQLVMEAKAKGRDIKITCDIAIQIS